MTDVQAFDRPCGYKFRLAEIRNYHLADVKVNGNAKTTGAWLLTKVVFMTPITITLLLFFGHCSLGVLSVLPQLIL
jgi:hypothetical protein